MSLIWGHRIWCLLALAALALLAFSASAAAEVRSGQASDPEEGERLPAGRDIIAVSAGYDTVAGTIRAAVTTAGPPSTPNTALRADFFPVDAAGDCVEPEARIAAVYGEAAVAWKYGGAEGTGQKTVAANTTTLSATSAALANQPFTCMNAYILDLSDPENPVPIEYLIPPIELRAPPAPLPPAPPPPAPPAPLPPAPAPAKVAALAVAKVKPLTLRRNSWKQVKLRISNFGTATAAGVKLKIGKVRGVAIKPKSGKLKLKAIAAGGSKTARFRVLLTRKARRVSKLPVVVTGARGLKARAKIVVRAWKKRKKPKPPAAAGSLAEEIFYRYDETDVSRSAVLEGYAFIDDTWAYNGIPSGGLPHCTEVTGNSKNEGCVKYRYDPKTGAVAVGSIAGGKLTEKGLEIDGEQYSPLAIPKPGARYQVEQYNLSFYGLCGGFLTGCTTTSSYITLTNSGEFALSNSSLTTSGAGTDPFIAVGGYPPDEHGTYAIEKRARIRLAFADGTSETKTIAIFLNDKGRPDPVEEGFILDSTYYTFAATD